MFPFAGTHGGFILECITLLIMFFSLNLFTVSLGHLFPFQKGGSKVFLPEFPEKGHPFGDVY